MNQLTQYIIALTNLYGMVHNDKVVEIYNSQNEKKVSLTDVEKHLLNPSKELGFAFVYPQLDYFVHEVIRNNDEFHLMLKKKGEKPHYIPTKSELLNYVDESYFERSMHYNTLLDYVKKNFFKIEDEKAEWLCEDIQGLCQFGADIHTVFEIFNDYSITFKDMEQTNEMLHLVMDLLNNVRIWENNGHTPYEIFEKFEKRNEAK